MLPSVSLEVPMLTVILNGAERSHDPLDRLALRIEADVLGSGNPVRHFLLRDTAVGHCLGDFDCWVRTPGRCRIDDAGQEIERAVHDAGRVVMVTPLQFGGYAPTLKKAVDRLIPLILPFFARAADLTHHGHRYDPLPTLIGIGHAPQPSAAEADLFSAFVESQALNLGAPGWRAEVLDDTRVKIATPAALLAATAIPGNASGTPEAATAALRAAITADPAPRGFVAGPDVVILVGSARPVGASTSRAIADDFAARLRDAGARAEIIRATDFARGADQATATAHRLASADVLAVVAPLYVDALPALATQALAETAAVRAVASHPQRVIGIINCGFPEPEHLRFAFASLRHFAAATRGHFAGGLPLAGGEMIHGQALDSLGGMVKPLRDALAAAATALAAGDVIPPDVSLGLARPMMPPVLYRLAGDMGWRFKALSNGLWPSQLKAQPFDRLTEAEWLADARHGGLRSRPLRVIEKRPECPDVVTILFEDPAHDPLAHVAGQYITLDIAIDGARLRRAYSLASTPDEPGLAITVKRVPGGRMSAYLLDRLKVGDIVRSHGPSGSFTPGRATSARRLLLVGGGSGVVPLAAIARDVLRHEPGTRLDFILGAASRGRMIYLTALQDLAQRHADRLTLYPVFETDAAPGPPRRLDEAGIGNLLVAIAPARCERILLCGPDGMRDSLRTMLTRHGVDELAILEESFTSPRADAAAWLPQQLHLAESDRWINVAAGQSVLDALLDAGETISFSCLVGGCGACTVTVSDGTANLVLDTPNTISPAELAAGRVPACISRLTGPVRLQSIGRPA
jgi:ferredoxin-NADP reductase/NAD(P)H-dependent FMN reductase